MRRPSSLSAGVTLLLTLGTITTTVFADPAPAPAPAPASASEIQQMLASLPPCSSSCLLAATTAACGSVTDFACSCGPQSHNISEHATPCLLEACKKADIDVATAASASICRAVLGGGNSTSGSSSGNGSESEGESESSAVTTNGVERRMGAAMGTLGLVVGVVVMVVNGGL